MKAVIKLVSISMDENETTNLKIIEVKLTG